MALIFDYPESSIEPETINKIMYTYDVFVAVRPKSRQSTLCIVVKGIEKYITNVYEARHHLLKLIGPRLIADIPRTYFFSAEDTRPQKNNSLVTMLQQETGPAFSPFSSPMPFSTWNNPPTPANQHAVAASAIGIDLERFHDRFSHLSVNNSSSMPDISDTRRLLSATNNTQGNSHKSPNFLSSSISPRNNDTNSSGYQSMNYSLTSLENPSHLSNFDAALTDENYNVRMPPRKLSVDETAFSYNSSTNSQNSTSNNNNNYQHYNNLFGLEARILDGYNAMKQSLPGNNSELRTPKMGWQGLGLSRTSPAPFVDFHDYDKPMNAAKFNMSTMLLPDSTSSRQRERVGQYNDIASILVSLGLEHHIGKLELLFHNFHKETKIFKMPSSIFWNCGSAKCLMTS